jgi:hypothetical protein
MSKTVAALTLPLALERVMHFPWPSAAELPSAT